MRGIKIYYKLEVWQIDERYAIDDALGCAFS